MTKSLRRKMPGELSPVSRNAMGITCLLMVGGLVWYGFTTDALPILLVAGRDKLLGTVSLWHFVFFAVVVTAAFMVRGAAGFGSAAVAVPLAALALPIQFVIPVVAGLQLLSTTEYSARNWRSVEWREILRIAPFMLVGIILGLYLFNRLDAGAIANGLGIFVIVYAIYAMATAGHDPGTPRRLSWPIAGLLNTVGALVGALFGAASSPFYTWYFKSLHLSRDAFRASMTMVILVQVVLRIGGYADAGLFNMATFLVTLIAVPFMLLGGRIGDVIAERVSAIIFNRIVGAVLLVSGMALVIK